MVDPVGLVPPVWMWFPVTALAATVTVALHVDAVAGRHGRPRGARLLLGVLGGLLVGGPSLLGLLDGPGQCIDNEWRSGAGWLASSTGWVGVVVWFTAVTAVYALAGLGTYAVVAPVVLGLAIVPPVAVEVGLSWSALDEYCALGGARLLVVHLAVAALIPLGAVIWGLMCVRRHRVA